MDGKMSPRRDARVRLLPVGTADAIEVTRPDRAERRRPIGHGSPPRPGADLARERGLHLPRNRGYVHGRRRVDLDHQPEAEPIAELAVVRCWPGAGDVDWVVVVSRSPLGVAGEGDRLRHPAVDLDRASTEYSHSVSLVPEPGAEVGPNDHRWQAAASRHSSSIDAPPSRRDETSGSASRSPSASCSASLIVSLASNGRPSAIAREAASVDFPEPGGPRAEVTVQRRRQHRRLHEHPTLAQSGQHEMSVERTL
jgi:hypothetical protein